LDKDLSIISRLLCDLAVVVRVLALAASRRVSPHAVDIGAGASVLQRLNELPEAERFDEVVESNARSHGG
jgi:hypothetical protein